MSKDEAPPLKDVALTRSPNLVLILNTPKGRGVFASIFIPKGTIVEVSPVLIFTEDEVELHTSKTCLEHYTYQHIAILSASIEARPHGNTSSHQDLSSYWPLPGGKPHTQAVALGLGSMFNHSGSRQNVTWTRDIKSECLTYTAHRDIQAGEELCISYGHARLWFKDADEPEDDEYSMIHAKKVKGETDVELELSGLSGIDL